MSEIDSIEQTRMSQRDISAIIEPHSAVDDCEKCGWKIRQVKSWKVFFDNNPDMRQYNHSAIRTVKRLHHFGHNDAEPEYLVTVTPHNRKPGEDELLEIEVFHSEIRQADYPFASWVHLSPHHPEYADDVPKGTCTYGRPATRCPKCNSKQVKTTQEAWGDATNCPECLYHSFRSIGD